MAGKRWYDKAPESARAVTLLEAFPEVIQTIVSDGVITLANREKEILGLKSLGSEKVLGLYKAKTKKRTQDKNPVFRKALNDMYVLSDENKSFLCLQVLDLTSYIEQYLTTCKSFDYDPNRDDVAAMVCLYIERGSDEVKLFLESLKDHFEIRILDNYLFSGAPEPVLQARIEKTLSADDEVVREFTEDVGGGLRIRQNR